MVKRLGHGPWGSWPLSLWRKLFYDPRPDLITNKTRAPEWERLQSESRFFQALFCYVGPPSHILWNIKWPFLGVTAISIFMECITDLSELPIMDPSGLLKDCFRLTSFAMSLLLAFRLQRTYERWSLARASIGGVGNGVVSIFMLASSWIHHDPQLLDDFRRFCIMWLYALKQVCSGSKELDPRAAKLLRPGELAIYTASTDKRQVVVTRIRQLAVQANFTTDQSINMEAAIANTYRSASAALRVRSQAMPHGLTLMCTGFVEIWCLLLPIGLWSNVDFADWLTLPAMMLVALLLLGCDEMANQMEQPYSLIPMEEILSTYERDINRMQDEQRAYREEATAHRATSSAQSKPTDDPLTTTAAACCPSEHKISSYPAAGLHQQPTTAHHHDHVTDDDNENGPQMGTHPLGTPLSFMRKMASRTQSRAGTPLSRQALLEDSAQDYGPSASVASHQAPPANPGVGSDGGD